MADASTRELHEQTLLATLAGTSTDNHGDDLEAGQVEAGELPPAQAITSHASTSRAPSAADRPMTAASTNSTSTADVGSTSSASYEQYAASAAYQQQYYAYQQQYAAWYHQHQQHHRTAAAAAAAAAAATSNSGYYDQGYAAPTDYDRRYSEYHQDYRGAYYPGPHGAEYGSPPPPPPPPPRDAHRTWRRGPPRRDRDRDRDRDRSRDRMLADRDRDGDWYRPQGAPLPPPRDREFSREFSRERPMMRDRDFIRDRDFSRDRAPRDRDRDWDRDRDRPPRGSVAQDPDRSYRPGRDVPTPADPPASPARHQPTVPARRADDSPVRPPSEAPPRQVDDAKSTPPLTPSKNSQPAPPASASDTPRPAALPPKPPGGIPDHPHQSRSPASVASPSSAARAAAPRAFTASPAAARIKVEKRDDEDGMIVDTREESIRPVSSFQAKLDAASSRSPPRPPAPDAREPSAKLEPVSPRRAATPATALLSAYPSSDMATDASDYEDGRSTRQLNGVADPVPHAATPPPPQPPPPKRRPKQRRLRIPSPVSDPDAPPHGAPANATPWSVADVELYLPTNFRGSAQLAAAAAEAAAAAGRGVGAMAAGKVTVPGRRKTEDEEEERETLYCICRTPYDDNQFYIGCDGCTDWFHLSCVGMPHDKSDDVDLFFCPQCTHLGRGITTWRAKCARTGCPSLATLPAAFCSDMCGVVAAMNVAARTTDCALDRALYPESDPRAHMLAVLRALTQAPAPRTAAWSAADVDDVKSMLTAVRGYQAARDGMTRCEQRLTILAAHAERVGGSGEEGEGGVKVCGCPLDGVEAEVVRWCEREACTRHRHWRAVVKGKLEVERVGYIQAARDAQVKFRNGARRVVARRHDLERVLFHVTTVTHDDAMEVDGAAAVVDNTPPW
ncbi:hypothetical protein AMAG_06663 [Allomyces macrogynus ATCC 38327]|uniref:PHD-type domain-containing protein n=1 Tax=Allomyces macrogynus (strain ATCC 38327) TaxID=578462 RepID=A0A0L0SEE1_ALLM3|nr:hypothetical protein AMAG_06663 [Allomyces macrogynus ATCC 38327]|eukprot:KNE60903.1 hypothetical protein AMAG_06663 [Allomyces macrogynus ATCC 38327]